VQSSTSFAGTEIMRVADPSKMEARVNVNENDIVNVKVGDPVKISIDAYPDRKFNGVVREIGASAANSGGSGSGTAAASGHRERRGHELHRQDPHRERLARPASRE
jgi:multidrug resistance efflux pump